MGRGFDDLSHHSGFAEGHHIWNIFSTTGIGAGWMRGWGDKCVEVRLNFLLFGGLAFMYIFIPRNLPVGEKGADSKPQPESCMSSPSFVKAGELITNG